MPRLLQRPGAIIIPGLSNVPDPVADDPGPDCAETGAAPAAIATMNAAASNVVRDRIMMVASVTSVIDTRCATSPLTWIKTTET
ncbi:MAG: hypothetical protein K8H87_02730 [Pseudorhodoplanes sp.]|nr:hypothetical protein [Pseudorhodoplanes sp.]